MAASTTAARAVAFRFHLAASPPHPNHHLSLRPLPPKPNKPLSFSSYTHPSKPTTISPPKSIDVSKEDKPTSSASDQNPAPPPPLNFAESESEPEQNLEFDSSQGIDKRRPEEKFAVLNTGIYECRSCGFKYDQTVGDPSYPIPPGLPFSQLPEDWRCGTCGAAKSFFDSKSVEIAGFAQNQQFGLGGNTLTSGQKALLIYGSLLFFFVLFLSGYFLQ